MGKQTGSGVMYFRASNERYEGQWSNGKMTGEGKYFFNTDDKKVYTGKFFNGDMYGYGVIETANYIYRGMVKNGLFDRFGRYENLQTHVVYEGNFLEGEKDGFGREYSYNADDYSHPEYEGNWKKGMKDGKGKQIFRALNQECSFIEGVWNQDVLCQVIQKGLGKNKEIEDLNELDSNSFSRMIRQKIKGQRQSPERAAEQPPCQNEMQTQMQILGLLSNSEEAGESSK